MHARLPPPFVPYYRNESTAPRQPKIGATGQVFGASSDVDADALQAHGWQSDPGVAGAGQQAERQGDPVVRGAGSAATRRLRFTQRCGKRRGFGGLNECPLRRHFIFVCAVVALLYFPIVVGATARSVVMWGWMGVLDRRSNRRPDVK